MGVRTSSNSRKIGREAACLALIGLLTVLYFWPVLFGEKSLYLTDFLFLAVPQAQMTVEALSAGEIPHWEPRMDFGYPYQADPHSLVFYPLLPLLFAAPIVQAFNLFISAHFLLGAALLFALLRRWGVERLPAILGALTYAFGGYMLGATGVLMIQRGSVWLPLPALMFDYYQERGGLRWIAATAAALALQGSGSDPQFLLFSVVLMAMIPLVSPNARWRGVRDWLGGIAGSSALAIGLLACQYVPVLHLLLNSDRAGGLGGSELGLFAVDPWNLLSALFALPFPDPREVSYYLSFHHGSPPILYTFYLGAPVLLLVVCGMAYRPRVDPVGVVRHGLAGPVMGLGIVFCICLSVGDRLPVFRWVLEVVPLLKIFRYPIKYYALAAFWISVLAAFGLQGMLTGSAGCRRMLVGAGSSLLVLISALMAAVWAGGDDLARVWLTGSAEPGGSAAASVAALQSAWFAGIAFAWGMVGLCLILIWAARSGRIPLRTAIVGIAILAIFDLISTTRTQLALIDRDLIEKPPAAIQYMPSPEAGRPPPRFASYLPDQLLFQDEWTHTQIVLLRYQLMKNLCGVRFDLNCLGPSATLRTRTNVRYSEIAPLLGSAELDLFQAKVGAGRTLRVYYSPIFAGPGRVAGRSGPLLVQELTDVMPRAFIAGQATPVEADLTPEQSKAAIWTLPDRTLFEPAKDAPSPGPLVPDSIGSCRIAHYGRHRVQIDFELKGRGLLVLLDAPFPLWRATVDGEERPIHRVAGLFRGVEVREGESSLEMAYEPRPFRVGVAISLCFLIFWLTLVVRPAAWRAPQAKL